MALLKQDSLLFSFFKKNNRWFIEKLFNNFNFTQRVSVEKPLIKMLLTHFLTTISTSQDPCQL
jgi:hypothetical protein